MLFWNFLKEVLLSFRHSTPNLKILFTKFEKIKISNEKIKIQPQLNLLIRNQIQFFDRNTRKIHNNFTTRILKEIQTDRIAVRISTQRKSLVERSTCCFGQITCENIQCCSKFNVLKYKLYYEDFVLCLWFDSLLVYFVDFSWETKEFFKIIIQPIELTKMFSIITEFTT